MAIKKICVICKGETKKPDPIHSYDFNDDGWVPFYCIECGLCSDSDYITRRTHIISAIMSHRFIKGVLQVIFKTMLKQDYVFKSELFKLLKDKNFSGVYDLAEQIALHCNGRGYSITTAHVSTIIYSELGYSSFI